jgi:hypothetical protein
MLDEIEQALDGVHEVRVTDPLGQTVTFLDARNLYRCSLSNHFQP